MIKTCMVVIALMMIAIAVPAQSTATFFHEDGEAFSVVINKTDKLNDHVQTTESLTIGESITTKKEISYYGNGKILKKEEIITYTVEFIMEQNGIFVCNFRRKD